MDWSLFAAFLAIFATLATFMLGVVFYAGKLAARVDSLETWRSEVRAMHEENKGEFAAIRRELHELASR